MVISKERNHVLVYLKTYLILINICHVDQVDSLKGSSLIEVADLIIKRVKEGSHHALELFPKVLSVISSQKRIHYHKGKSKISSRI